MKHYCVSCKRFASKTKAMYVRTSNQGRRSWKPVRYICYPCLEIRPQPLPPRDDITIALEVEPPVERIPIEPGELGSEYLERVIEVAKAKRAVKDV